MDEHITSRGTNEPYLVMPKQRRQSTTKRANARFDEIRDRLRELALKLGPGSQLPPIRELCTLLGTSSITLTAVLDQMETEHIIYRKERQGIFVSPSIEQKVIHVFFDVSAFDDAGQSPFWALLYGHLTKEADYRSVLNEKTYQFHYIRANFANVLPRPYVELLQTSHASGCILVGINAREDDPEHTNVIHIPHVVFAGGGNIMVGEDPQQTTQLVTQLLLRQGCQHISFWFPHWKKLDGILRAAEIDFLRQNLSEAGLPFHPEFMRKASIPPTTDQRSMTLQEQGYLLAKEMFGSGTGQKPDGIYINNEMMTTGALVAWEEMGIRPGIDIKVVSHSTTGSPMLFGKAKQVSVVDFDAGELARTMFTVLDAAIARGYVEETRYIKLPMRLRNSGL